MLSPEEVEMMPDPREDFKVIFCEKIKDIVLFKELFLNFRNLIERNSFFLFSTFVYINYFFVFASLRSKDHKKRPYTHLSLKISDDLSIGCNLFNMIRSCPKPKKVKLDKSTNMETKTVTNRYVEVCKLKI
jgi:hypothetical protein